MSCAYFNWDFRHHPLRWLIVIPLVVSNFGMYHCITVSQSQHTSGSGRLLTFTQTEDFADEDADGQLQLGEFIELIRQMRS
jgi:hypothetical protein